MADQPTVDPDRDALLRALAQSGAAYVVIGGVAVQSHDQAYITLDVDVTPSRSLASLRLLATTLNGLECSLVIDPEDPNQDVALPVGYFTAATLKRQDVWNLMTAHGKLDISFAPSGFPNGYDELLEHAQRRRVAQTSVVANVAALADVEHSKRTAGRPKDRDYLEAVGRLATADEGARGTGREPLVAADRDASPREPDAAHLVVLLGPRPPHGALRRVWDTTARAVDAFRARHGIVDDDEPLGAAQPAASSQAQERRQLERRIDRARRIIEHADPEARAPGG